MDVVRGAPANSRGKQIHRKVCSHGLCSNSNRQNPVADDVKFIRFPQACIAYRNEQVERLLGQTIEGKKRHIPKSCMQCSKALRWLNMCKRKDFNHLLHINNDVYICSKHFVDTSGPTPSHPDPLPTNISADAIASIRKRVRKAPKDRSLQSNCLKKSRKVSNSEDAKQADTCENNSPYIINCNEVCHDKGCAHMDCFEPAVFDEEHMNDEQHDASTNEPIITTTVASRTDCAETAVFHEEHDLTPCFTDEVTASPLNISQNVAFQEPRNDQWDTEVIREFAAVTDVGGSVGSLSEEMAVLEQGNDQHNMCIINTLRDVTEVHVLVMNPSVGITENKDAVDKFESLQSYAASFWNTPWAVQLSPNCLQFCRRGKIVCMNLMEVHVTYVDSIWMCDIFVYGKPISTHSTVYRTSQAVCSLQSLDQLISEINTLTLCSGIARDASTKSLMHYKNGYICPFTSNIRSTKCKLLCNIVRCIECTKYLYTLNARVSGIKKGKHGIGSRSCNNRYLTKQQLITKLNLNNMDLHASHKREKRMRRKCQQLLSRSGITIGKNNNQDLKNILLTLDTQYEDGDFRKIFISEQLKASNRKSCKGYIWHPEIIKFALYMHRKNSGAYDAIRHVLLLPSKSKMYDYSKHMTSEPGFVQAIPNKIIEQVTTGHETTSDHQSYFSLIFDEIKLSEELVYNKITGQLIGFVKLNDSEDALAQLAYQQRKKLNQKSVATHMLQLMVKGLSSSASFLYAYFPTNGMTAKQLYAIVREAVERLELQGIKILAIVCDGHAVNRTFMKLASRNKDIPYYMNNPYAVQENRPIYFIPDTVHLIKTVRNSFSSSRIPTAGKQVTRLLWKNGQHIVWKSVHDVYYWDLKNNPRVLPKLTDCHIHLNPQSQMRVKFAVQVLSNSTAAVMEHLYGQHVSETVKFIRMFNKYFDVMNVRNLYEGKHKRDENLNPYTSATDKRLMWLDNEFSTYLNDWQTEVLNRPGDFTADDQEKMMLAKPTIQGLHMTVKSIPAVVKFLLGKGAKFVLTGRMNQDSLEQTFAKQRAAAGAHTNPDTQRYSQNFRKLQILKNYAITGKGMNTEKQ